MIVTFTIPGKPMAKQRPRVTSNGTFTPQQTIDYENFVKYLYQSEVGKFLEGQLSLEMKIYYPILKSTSKKQAALMVGGEIRPTKKPDADNVMKIVTDALNKIAYHDDSQIVQAYIEKLYAVEPRVEVVLKTL